MVSKGCVDGPKTGLLEPRAVENRHWICNPPWRRDMGGGEGGTCRHEYEFNIDFHFNPMDPWVCLIGFVRIHASFLAQEAEVAHWPKPAKPEYCWIFGHSKKWVSIASSPKLICLIWLLAIPHQKSGPLLLPRPPACVRLHYLLGRRLLFCQFGQSAQNLRTCETGIFL